MICTSIPLDAPATPAELAAILNVDERSVRRRATRENWPRTGGHTYAPSNLPDDLREALLAKRKRGMENFIAKTADDGITVKRLESLPQDFPDTEQKLARCKADFVLDVFRTLRAHPHLTQLDAVRLVVSRAEKIHPLPYQKVNENGEVVASLWTAGRGGGSLLSISDSRCPAKCNFNRWQSEWRPYRRDDLDDYQFWALCKRYGIGAKKFRENYWKNEIGAKGDKRFWAAFRMKYDKSAGLSFEEAYNECLPVAHANGWQPIPLHRIKYFYTEVMSEPERREVARAREGRKAWYDRKTIYIIRDWRRVPPDECWSFDGHKFDVWVAVFDATRHGWFPVRPWLVNCVDSCSWFEVGRHITAVTGRDSIDYAIRDALLKYHRLPGMFYFDNGREFKAEGAKFVTDEKRVLEVSGNFSVDCMFALPYNPRAKINERDYRNVVNWFERKQPSYAGNAAINKSNFDQRWYEMHQPGGVLERADGSTSGRLAHPERLPSLEQFIALYDKYRAEIHHQRIRSGKICPRQSPAEKYLSAVVNRRLTEDEIALGFLEYVSEQTIGRCPRISFKPRGVNAAGALEFEDPMLLNFTGKKVVVKVDTSVEPIRCFAFERLSNDRLQLIKCGGPFGSVPIAIGIHPFRASTEEIRDRQRTYRSWVKAKRTGERHAAFIEARNALADQEACNRGITAEQAKVYVLTDEKIIEHAEGQKQQQQQNNEALAALEAQVGADDLAAYERGT
jgi:hypothetical protein